MTGCHSLLTPPNWAPAFAGVVLGFERRGAECATYPLFLFSREGGSPGWIPAFAGKHSYGVGGRRF